jgi:hypothetical protein
MPTTGGLITQLHAVGDERCPPRLFSLPAGMEADFVNAQALLESVMAGNAGKLFLSKVH